MQSSYIEFLKGSDLVWDFQRYFGVLKVAHSTSDNRYTLQNGTKTTSQSSSEEAPVSNGNGFVHTRDNNGIQYESLHFRKTEDTNNEQNDYNNIASSDSGMDETVSESELSDARSVDKTRYNQDYVITNKFWYYLFAFGTSLGDETFYASFFPFWFWNIDGAVGRRVVMVWVMIMYIGQGLKDIIRWPRPDCPPAVRLEKKWALEYGMPSTHAMVGIGVPFSVLYYTMYRYEYPFYLGFILCSLWCVVVCCSRVYMGMHCVLDIIGGLLLSTALLTIFLPLLDSLDYYQLTHPYAPFMVLGTILFLALAYPSSDRWTPARGDTTIILGVGAGCSFGSWLNFQLGIIRGPPMPPPYQILWPTYEMVGLTLLRTCIGILIVVATRAFFRTISYVIVCWILRLDRRDTTNNQKIIVELSCKFITYAALGFNATYLCPTVFRFLNIERVTMLTEV